MDSAELAANNQTPAAKAYLPSLLTTQPGTHLLETILLSSPSQVFASIWELYFIGKIGRLAGHPTANYVIAKAVGRLDLAGVEAVVKECRAVAGGKGMISMLVSFDGQSSDTDHAPETGRISVLQALIDRAVTIVEARQPVIEVCLPLFTGTLG